MADDHRAGVFSSSTRRHRRNTAVVGADEPMPSVSKKLVPNPISKSERTRPMARRRVSSRVGPPPLDDEQRAAGQERSEQRAHEGHRWDAIVRTI